MPIMRDWHLAFDQAQFMQQYGHTLVRVLRRPGMPEILDAIFSEIAGLVEPAVVWELVPVQEMHHETVILADGQHIGNGPVTTVMGGASQLAIGVCTIGPAVSDRIHEHKEAGQAVRSVLLDTASIGVSLTGSLLMNPIKSLSLMAGIGSQPMGVPGTTHCDYCTMADRCQFHGAHASI